MIPHDRFRLKVLLKGYATFLSISTPFEINSPLNRVIESGLLILDDGDTVSKVSSTQYFYDQENALNSQGRLSLSFNNQNIQEEYGERYNYDARGRLISQTNFWDAVLDSTMIDSLYVSQVQDSGWDTASMVIEKDTSVYYWLERILSQDSLTYLILKRNDTVIVDSRYPPICDTISDSIECNAGDLITLVAHIEEGVDTDATYARLYGVASYKRFDTPQKYLTGTRSYTIAYEYNHADQLTSITYPDGMVVTYEYDDRGRLVGVGNPEDADRYAYITYTPRNEIETMILGGLDADSLQTLDYTYNARGWLNTINDVASTDSAPADLFAERLYYYGYPDSTWTVYYNGNIMAQELAYEANSSDTLLLYSYTYDDMDRLIGVYPHNELWNFRELFEYDANGNTLWRKYGLDSLSYYYSAGTNRLDSTARKALLGTYITKFWYDENGNLATDSGRNAGFCYDLYNRLDTVLFPGGDDTSYIAFGYTPEGLRIYKDYHYWYLDECNGGGIESSGPEGLGMNGIESGGDSLCLYYGQVATRYVREKPGGKVLAEYVNNPDHPLKFKFIYAGNQRIAMYDQSGNLHFYLNDHLGSARMVIDSTGTVKDTYKRYYAFGDAAQQTVSTDQRYRYTGKPFDDEGAFDLYYYGARYYDPKLGRFIAVDPLAGKYPSWSPYAYTLDNPMNLLDPDGSEPVQDQMAEDYKEAATYFNLWNPFNYGFGESARRRYIPLEDGTVIDMLHFSAAAMATNALKFVGPLPELNMYRGALMTQAGGILVESLQLAMDFLGIMTRQARSAFEPDDLPSNLEGSLFILQLDIDQSIIDQLIEFLEKMGAISLDKFKELYPDIWENMAFDNVEADKRHKERLDYDASEN